MTDSNVARLVRDPSTGEMASLKPSTDDLDLTTLPERLDDATLARVEAIARSPLPPPEPCDRRTLDQALRMMLAVLPRRQADEISGELFVAAYERQLGGYPNDAIQMLCDEAIRTRKWFPTVSECLEILSEWRRNDEEVRRRLEAHYRLRREQDARYAERQSPPPVLRNLTQADVDMMNPTMIEIGLKCGALVRDADGNVGPAPEAAE